MPKFRIGQLVMRLDGEEHMGRSGIGVVCGVRDHGTIVYVEFFHNLNIQRGCSAHLLRPLTREERAVRIARQAMGLKP